MSPELEMMLDTLGRVHGLVNELILHAGAAVPRARDLARALRSLCPDSPLSFALLAREGARHAAAVDAAGRPAGGLAEVARGALAGLRVPGPGRLAGCFPLPSGTGLGRHVLVFHAIAHRAAHFGFLGVALPEGDSPAWTSGVQTVLDHCARLLGVRLALEAREREQAAAREELARQAALADVAELAGPLAHEVNNLLNVLLLQVAALSEEAPGPTRVELERIRRQGQLARALVRQWQHCRRRFPPGPRPIDLNEVVCQALGELTREDRREDLPRALVLPAGVEDAPRAVADAVPVSLRLAPSLPPVAGQSPDFKRILTFLLKNAVAAMGPRPGAVCVETEAVGGRVLLRVADSGPPAPPDVLGALFDPAADGREGTNPLELAACESMARRHQGKVLAENRAGGGLTVTLDLPAAP